MSPVAISSNSCPDDGGASVLIMGDGDTPNPQASSWSINNCQVCYRLFTQPYQQFMHNTNEM